MIMMTMKNTREENMMCKLRYPVKVVEGKKKEEKVGTDSGEYQKLSLGAGAAPD